MPDLDRRPRPLTVEVDLAHGGRWTSLRTPEREWLWRHPDPAVGAARAAVGPGAAFVDAGGVEECLPTVRGEPDHGAVWSRPWSATGVSACGFRLDRRIRADGAVTVDYTITGPPHAPVVHAVHALLDVSPAARLDAPGVRAAHLIDQDAVVPWPGGLDRLGPDDGTATAAVLPGCAAVTVVDGPDALELTWRAADPALLLWRNLRGWPAGAPYRSIGVEPMIGTAATPSGPGEPARLDADGVLRWRLTVRAWRAVGP
ncbi:hypothetical protein [Pseudonocardia adelaidensis]|uniref:Galactose mutarotase-like enzyme n=1 Tax=Pseudonocardia adelaidensis TaxID=648754 RepID=A0ABP9NPQ6_9PSEU